MAGYFTERFAEGIKDHLYSRALVLSEGDTHVALVTTDLISFMSQDLAAVRERVEKRLGIPGSHVFIAASHTHTGPVTRGALRNDGYMEQWAALTAGAVELAFRDRTEVTLGVGKGSLPGVAFNRRFFMKNGYVHTNPGVGNPDIIEPAGPEDSDVIVLRFDGPDGTPVGMLTSFACHCDTVGGNRFSADWVGVAAAKIREMMQPKGTTRPFGVMVINCASGDINHYNVNDPDRRKRWPSFTEEIGIGLAGESVRVAVSLSPKPCDQLGAASTEVKLQRMPVEEFLAKSKRALEDPRVGRMERTRAESNLKRTSYDEPEEFTQEVMCVRTGPVLIMGGPGEMFTELGLRFKNAFPDNFAMVANLANGWLGYVPSARAYEEGGYEARSTRLQPGSGEALIDAGIALGKQLVK